MSCGRSVVWLHKLDDGGCEVSFTIRARTGLFEELECHLGDNYRGQWDSELARMQPGDWVRFQIKWELHFHKFYDSYYGAYEYDSSIDVQRLRTLRRGHYRPRYQSKSKELAHHG